MFLFWESRNAFRFLPGTSVETASGQGKGGVEDVRQEDEDRVR